MIIPGIFETELNEIEHKIRLVEKEVTMIQIDMADGIFVETKTFPDLKKISELKSEAPFEVHLMVKDPTFYLSEKYSNVKRMLAGVETDNIMDFLLKASAMGYEVGLSLNPETSLDALKPFVDKINYVQFMTVVPGGQGRNFHAEVLEKITEFKRNNPNIRIQADGGIDEHNIVRVLKAGADDLVIGSAIFEKPKPVRKVNKVAFLGGAGFQAGDQTFQDAYEVAKILSRNGYEIVNGGGPGVMRASTIGAHDGGGKALAVTYHPNKYKKNYEGTDPENKFDEEIYTLDYFDRTKVMLQNSDAHIVFNGASGTISEFGMTWASSRIHDGNSKPIILYGKFWEEIIEAIKKNMKLRPGEEHYMKICCTPEEVLSFITTLN